jgi:nucleoside-diphosphate-sugar epimerase
LFNLVEADASEPPTTYLPAIPSYDFIFHLASPASPANYQHNPVATYKVNAFGTHHLTMYAQETGARLLFASTSEAYGEPLEHPQKETYWGNVNPTGVRSMYDESKRFGEMVVTTFVRKYDTDGRIVRIFNTYGPRLSPEDGRVISTLINQALNQKPLTVHGDGSQTRSFCYVDDLVEYLVRAQLSDRLKGEVVNIGNPDEHNILEIATTIKKLTGSNSEIVYVDRPEDDPTRRQPDISKAQGLLDFTPQIALEEGLQRTIDWYRENS